MAGTTSSRNRFGQYRRTRAAPVNPRSTAQGLVRAHMAANSAAWRALTSDQRAGWGSLGAMIQRTDALGQAYTLTGFQAYCSINGVNLAAGNAIVAAAPALSTPAALLTATITSTGGTLSVAYTTTPLAASVKLMLYASPQRSAGRQYEGDFRLIAVTAAAAASPHNLLAAYSARFGVPVVGNRIFFSLVNTIGGFESGPLVTSHVIIT